MKTAPAISKFKFLLLSTALTAVVLSLGCGSGTGTSRSSLGAGAPAPAPVDTFEKVHLPATPIRDDEDGIDEASKDGAVVRPKVDLLDPELLRAFDLLLYVHVSKLKGHEQHLVAKVRDHDTWTEAFDWPVVAAFHTPKAVPIGVYQFDPDRMTVIANLMEILDLRYAMSFDVSLGDRKAPFMIDGADVEAMKVDPKKIASGIHLPFEKAHTLYDLLQKHYRGAVPTFAWDAREKRTSRYGVLQRNARGDSSMRFGYKALIIVTAD